MYCLRLVLQDLVYCYFCGVFTEKYVYTKLAIYVPIVIYGLRLFIVVLQELHCLPNYLHVCLEVTITSSSFIALYLR